jgi:calnexin
VALPENFSCGGAYTKLIMEESKVNLNNFNNEDPYVVMFGPDRCGSDSKVKTLYLA